jgi:hypothetical protein
MVLRSAYSLYSRKYHITVVSGNTLEAVKLRRQNELSGVKKNYIQMTHLSSHKRMFDVHIISNMEQKNCFV